MTFQDMLTYIKKKNNIKKMVETQLKMWWKKDDIIENIELIYNKYLTENKELNIVIERVKQLLLNVKNDPVLFSKAIDTYLVPHEIEKKINAEVSTPHFLRQQMLDKIPADFWSDVGIDFYSDKPIYPTVFEPCCGKGGFVVDIVNKLMVGLKAEIEDEEERYRVIVEECLYFADKNPNNIYTCKLLLNPEDKYKLNYYEGNTLELDIEEQWGIEGFDLVVGNPPYNQHGRVGSGNTLWQHFTKVSLNKFLNPNGYLLYVHPAGWRKPCYKKSQLNGLFKLLCKDNEMIYLSIHDIKDGKHIFNCGTKYDWYLIKNNNNNNNITLIRDKKNIMTQINLNKLDWLPNYNIKNVIKLIDNSGINNLEVIMNSSYHATRKYVNDKQNNEYKYPCIHSTPKSGIRYMYSKINNKGHFGVSKVIFGESGINHVIVDIEGKYGMTQGAMGIIIDDIKEGENIKKALLSDKFSDVLKSCMWGNFRIEWKLFTYFRKDFWKEFI